jgi:hypothetical protein
VESSYEFRIEPSGSIKCWETIEPYYRDTGTKIPDYMCVYLSSVTADNGIVTQLMSAHV